MEQIWEEPILISYFNDLSFPRASQMALVVKNSPAKAGDIETGAQSLGWEDSLEEVMTPIPVFLPAESHGQRSLAGYSS